MKKAAGLDVNGWRDHVARNWRSLPGGDIATDRIYLGSAGPLTSIVEIGDGKAARWIGGQPADLAPHGRGGGWGRVGEMSRRRPVREMLEGEAGEPAHLAAAFADFARRASHTVLAIEDSPDTTEALQEQLLAGMSAARCGAPALVWRTVLAALHAIDAGLVRDECKIGVISHVSAGLSVQKLRIRAAEARSGILTPERSAVAAQLLGNAGLRGLVAQARQAASGPADHSSRRALLAQSRTIGRVAFGMKNEAELIRLDNGGWEVVEAPLTPPPDPDLLGEVPDLSDCAHVILETITEGRVRDGIKALLHMRGAGVDMVLPPDAVARGALVAAQRMSAGHPVYFDFLPRISTIVFGPEGAANFDLIDENEALEAGRIYRSPYPAKLAIPNGVNEVSVYLRKDAARHPRKASVGLEVAPASDIPVSVWVEQKPASGRARIVMDAPALSRSFQVDWETAEEDVRAWDEIVASLATPPPAIPDRLVLECGLEPWEASRKNPGMAELLAKAQGSGSPDWELLADKATYRPFQKYCVSSDGALPEGLSSPAEQDLDRMTRKAVAVTQRRLEAGPERAGRDNAALRFLTWQFRRCPPQVSEWLLDCIENHAGRTDTHPFAWTPANWTLLYQGLARIAAEPEIEKRILRAILGRDPATWKWNQESACLALLISRSETAPGLLSRRDIDCIGQRIIAEMQSELGTKYTKFYYTILLAGGIFRYRQTEPCALLVGRDQLADRLFDVFDEVRCDLADRPNPGAGVMKRGQKYLPIMEDLLRYLRGEGGNPGLLVSSYNAN